ncbi:putative NUDIX hydrolase [Corynebacterium ciconiae DSM 44920]|uniref:NUDIX domain-containing protein n=1 Tax=Corynebacterium ciconiae TaxID=227319 RepID=UPI00037F8671|nr:NUDIX hydrolase [Corynebacterium ciconiae]WKD62000.1 putative NUDIX hydrolase [Corynebacterium ciconiae DSM 44920]
MDGDGNGWSFAPDGSRRWGLFGAAGLFLIASPRSNPRVLLQHRAHWTAEGGTWALPGGARDSHETAVEAALREAREETSIDTSRVDVVDSVVTAGPYLSGWSYTQVLATCPEPLATQGNEESVELHWVPLAELSSYPLMTAFAESLPLMRSVIAAGEVASISSGRPQH